MQCIDPVRQRAHNRLNTSDGYAFDASGSDPSK